MTETTIPDWLHVGARVACHTIGLLRAQRVTFATVTKIGKRDVVLDNGSRFNVNHLSRSTGAYSPTTYLKPTDDPAVLRDLRVDRRERTAYAVERAMRDWRESGDGMHAERAIASLRRALDDDPTTDCATSTEPSKESTNG